MSTIKDLYLSHGIIGENNASSKRWWDDDGDGIGYEPGEVDGKFKKKKKKKKVEEGYSNWREELFEISKKEKSEKQEQIKEMPSGKSNSITISPEIKETIESLGGNLLEAFEYASIFSELNEHEIHFISNNFIENVVEETLYEFVDEGYEIDDVVKIIIENINVNQIALYEAKVTYGHDTDAKSEKMGKVKDAAKKIGKKIAKSAGYAAGASVRGAKSAAKEFSSGYKEGRKKESSKSSGILSRIGSKLKSGLRNVVTKGARFIADKASKIADRSEKSTPSSNQTSTTNSANRSLRDIATSKRKRDIGQRGKRLKNARTQANLTSLLRSEDFVYEDLEISSDTLIEMVDYDYLDHAAQSVYAELLDEGYEVEDVEDSIYYAIFEAKVTFGHDTKKPRSIGKTIKVVGRLARRKLSQMKDSAKKLMVKGARKIAAKATEYADKNEPKTRTENFFFNVSGRLLEREMTSGDKAKENKLKKKFDDSQMKQNMIDQYGKEKGTQIYFAKIRKMAMEDYELDEAKLSRTEKREKSAGKKKGSSKTMHLVDLDANAMKPKKKGVEAKIGVKSGGKTTKELDPQQFNHYKFKDDEKPDFSQFRSSKIFKKTLKGNKHVRNLHRGGEASGLTARGGMDNNREVKSHVKASGFNKKHGVNFKGVHFTGDVPGKGTDDKKMKVIKNLIKAKKPKTIKFSDDHAKNLSAPENFNKKEGKDKTKNRGSSTPKIKTYLTRDDGRPKRFGSGGGGIRDPKAVNKSSSPQENQRRRAKARRGMSEEAFDTID